MDSSRAEGIVEHRLRPGATIMHQGQLMRRVSAIKVGLVVLHRRAGVPAADRGRAIAVIGPGQTLGVRAWLGDHVAGLDAMALTEVRVCSREVPADPPAPLLARAAFAQCSRLAEALADWAAIGRLPLAIQRVEAALHRLAQAAGSHRVLLPERAVLAELSACAPETVSRAMGQLIRRGRLLRGERRNEIFIPPHRTHTLRSNRGVCLRWWRDICHSRC